MIICCALSLLGCGDGGPPRYVVSGTVTWRGEPLPAGQIVFEPLDPQVPGASGTITAGTFRCLASAGAQRVKIFAQRAAATVDSTMGAAPQEQYLPARYNHESQLQAEILAAGPNELKFDLVE
jgi:hypothetical protein